MKIEKMQIIIARICGGFDKSIKTKECEHINLFYKK
tara:strand:+ start:397 stop:504 length:108 start_codon:yes stop_codon:yes gene_type:complete